MVKNKKKAKKKNNYLYITFLFVFNSFLHRIWLFPNAIIANGDWGYLSSETLKQIQWGSWVSSVALENPFGTPNFLPLRFLITAGQGSLAYLGFNQQGTDMMLFYIPMLIVGPLGIYLLLNHLTKTTFGSFIGSLFYLFNGYILVWAAAGYPLVYVYYIVPLLILLFEILFTTYNFRLGLLFALFLSIVVFFDLRLAVLICIFLFFYLLYLLFLRHITLRPLLYKRNFLIMCILFFLFLGMNYYLVVFSLSKNIQEALSTAITSRVLIKPGYFFLSNALTTFYPFWTGGQPTMFFMQNTPWYFWIIPPYIFLSGVFIRKEKIITFFLISSLLLVFLGKGPTPPLAGVYEWAYYHLPIFDFFRESSKFWQLLLLTFSILIAFSIKNVFELIDIRIKNIKIKRGIKIIFIAPLIFIIFMTSKPALTSEIGPGYISYEIPKEYNGLNKFITSQKYFFRLLQLPTYSRFLTYSDIHPRITINQIPLQFQSLSPYILRLFAIQYMVVPTDPYFEIFPGNSSQEAYLDIVGRKANKFKTFDSLTLYKNPLPAVPHIYTSSYINTIRGKFASIDSVISHINDKNTDFYVNQELQNNTGDLPKIQNHTLQYITILSCKTCLEFVASDSAIFDSFQSDESSYKIEIDKYGLSQVALRIDNNEILLDEDDLQYYTNELLEKEKHKVSLAFFRSNLSLDQGRNEYLLQKKNETLLIGEKNLKPYTSYKLSFDYSIPKNINHTVVIRQNTDFYFQYQQGKPGGPAWNAFNGSLLNDGNWHTAEMTFTTLFNPQQVALNFIASHDRANIKVKNITLIANNKPEIFISRTFQEKNETSHFPTLIFQQINPTKYVVKINDAKEPFFLVFAEQYNKYWQAVIRKNKKDLDNSKKIKVSNNVYEIPAKNNIDLWSLFFDVQKKGIIKPHFMINGYANAWYIEKPGTYEIEITFLPQKEFVLSLLISFIFFSTCIIILGVLVYGRLFHKRQ